MIPAPVAEAPSTEKAKSDLMFLKKVEMKNLGKTKEGN